MANPWFRMYAEFAHDPKVQMMSEIDQRRFIMLLCLRCSNGDVTLHDDEVAFQLRISSEEWSDTKALLVSKKLIDKSNSPTAWDKRQYVSDSSRERVARHRERKKQQCNVTVTPPDTDTDTDTENKSPPISPQGDKPRAKRERFDPLQACPENVSPDVWSQWVRCRSEMGKPIKATTCKAQSDQLKNHPDPDEVIRRSIAAGWVGLFPEKIHGTRKIDNRSGSLSAPERVKQAIAEREAATTSAGQTLGENGGDVRPPLDGEFRRVC